MFPSVIAEGTAFGADYGSWRNPQSLSVGLLGAKNEGSWTLTFAGATTPGDGRSLPLVVTVRGQYSEITDTLQQPRYIDGSR